MCNWASPRGVVERRDLRKSSRHDVHVRARGFPNGSRLVGQTTTDSGKLTRWVRWRPSPAGERPRVRSRASPHRHRHQRPGDIHARHPGASRGGSTAPPDRRAPAPAAAHPASQRAHRLCAGRRETGRRTADDGRRAGRAARRHHRRGAHVTGSSLSDRDSPADHERATLRDALVTRQ